MKKTQAETLSNSTIEHIYIFFETGKFINKDPLPENPVIKDSFTKTMGRLVVSDDKNTRIVIL